MKVKVHKDTSSATVCHDENPTDLTLAGSTAWQMIMLEGSSTTRPALDASMSQFAFEPWVVHYYCRSLNRPSWLGGDCWNVDFIGQVINGEVAVIVVRQ